MSLAPPEPRGAGPAAGSPDPATLPDPPGPHGRGSLLRAVRFGRNPLTSIHRLKARWGDVVMTLLGRRRLYVLSHPEMARDVLVTSNRNFIKSFALQRARVLLGEGLLTSEGDFHLRQRRLSQPAFHRDRVAAMAATMVRYAEDAADRWRAGMEVDATREMNRVTLAIAGMTLLGVDVEGEADEIGRALTDALGVVRPAAQPAGAAAGPAARPRHAADAPRPRAAGRHHLPRHRRAPRVHRGARRPAGNAAGRARRRG